MFDIMDGTLKLWNILIIEILPLLITWLIISQKYPQGQAKEYPLWVLFYCTTFIIAVYMGYCIVLHPVHIVISAENILYDPY